MSTRTRIRDVLVIERRTKRVGGRCTYWVHSADPRLGVVQVNSDRAKQLVEIGQARWATKKPIVTSRVEV